MHVLTLTDSIGSTVISLNDGSSVWTTSYRLGVADADATEAVDRIELLFIGPNRTATIRSIEMMLDRARTRLFSRRGPRIFVTVRRIDDDQTWRAELFQGSLTAEGVIDDSYKGTVQATLILQRSPVWEGEEVEIPLRNYNLNSPVSGGVIVPNDPAVGCWVQIDAGAVSGALPAPIRFRLTNNMSTSLFLRKLRVGVNAYTDVTINPVIQAEDAILSKGYDTATPSASGGSYWTSNSFTTEDLLNQWALPTGLTEASRGNWWWLMARTLFSYTPTAPPSFRAEIWDGAGVQVLWRGVDVRPQAAISVIEMVDLGPIPIPPGGYDDSPAPVRLTLYGQSQAPETVSIDYFYLFPMDSFRSIEQPSMSLSPGEFVEIDEIEQRYYIQGETGRLSILTVSGSPIRVVPNVVQRIHFLYQHNFSVPISREMLAQVWYRPRRLTV